MQVLPALIAETRRVLTEEMPLLALTAEIPARGRTTGTPLPGQTVEMPQARTAGIPLPEGQTVETLRVQTAGTPLARAGVPLEQTPVEVPAREERERQPLAG